ncbi:MAG: FAD-dependent oxidoreductase [Alphaproteobacteria bacterium]
MKSHARVVIIGGGVIGCSVAYHITKLGWRDVVLVERAELTSGSTWHAAGLNHLYSETAFLSRIYKESFDLYRSLEAETGQATGVHVTGGLRLARSADGMAEFRRYLAPAHALGIEADIVGVNRARELWPLLESDKFIGALHTPGEGYVDPTMTTNALAKGARNRGAEIYRHTRVTGLTQLPSGEWRVETDKGAITAEYVVNAAGCWGAEISKLLGHYLPVLTCEHQYLVTEQTDILKDLKVELPVLRDYNVPLYCRQERQGLMVSGYEHGVKLNWLDGAPKDFVTELFPPDLERATPCLEETFEMIPALKTLGIRTVVNGPIPGTPDMQGLLGPAHGLRNYFVCCGIHGGFVQGGLTRYLAEWIVEGEPSIDLSSVDVRRYGGYATKDYAVSRIEIGHMWSLPAAYPENEPQGGRPARTDALYERLAAKGAVFGVANGWEVPNWFAPKGVKPEDELSFGRANWFPHVAAECRAVRAHAGVLDLASQAKFMVEGLEASSFLERISASPLPQPGQRKLSLFLTPKGGIEILAAVDRNAHGGFFLSAPAASEQRLADLLRRHGPGVHVQNVTGGTGIFLLAGPAATKILEGVTGSDLGDISVGQSIEAAIGMASVHLTRVDDIDASAWEIRHPAEAQLGIYDALMKNDSRLVDFGMRAWNSLRLERGVARWGVDLSTDLGPRAAGLGHLLCRNKKTPERQDKSTLVLLDVSDKALPTDPWGGELVQVDGRTVGMVTSGAKGHTTGRSLAFAQLEHGHAKSGQRLEVVLLGQSYGAVVMDRPPA